MTGRNFKLMLIMAMVSVLPAFGQESAISRINTDPLFSAGNYNVYPAPVEASKVKAPKGFKAFYISHYARHGSRWLIGEADYKRPQTILHQQYEKGNLTDLGVDVMRRLDKVCEAADGRYEELTPAGAAQHRGIARRMYCNYPQVLGGNAKVRARSTVVIRCILSMNAFTNSLAGCNPSLSIEADASQHDMVYMNWADRQHIFPDIDTRVIRDSLSAIYIKPQRFMTSLFHNTENVPAGLFRQMYEICGNMQGTPASGISFYDLFTTDELYGLYLLNNLNWYFNHGNAPQTGNVRPYTQANLLKTIIAQADEAIAGGEYAADLRFGHDGNVSSLLSLMDINGLGVSVNDPLKVTDKWNISDIIPMAANLQMVFYRNGRGEVLVHFDLHEKEATLPIEAYKDNFYRWENVKAFWNSRLEKQD